MSDYQPTPWVRLTNADGKIKAETSDDEEIRPFIGPGDTVHRLYVKQETEWREEFIEHNETS